jgi:hypothetical protein
MSAPAAFPAVSSVCPYGSTSLCSGLSGCPVQGQVAPGEPYIQCSQFCDTNGLNLTVFSFRCWGTISCPTGTCPAGFEEGSFCVSQNSIFGNDLQVCCAIPVSSA